MMRTMKILFLARRRSNKEPFFLLPLQPLSHSNPDVVRALLIRVLPLLSSHQTKVSFPSLQLIVAGRSEKMKNMYTLCLSYRLFHLRSRPTGHLSLSKTNRRQPFLLVATCLRDLGQMQRIEKICISRV